MRMVDIPRVSWGRLKGEFLRDTQIKAIEAIRKSDRRFVVVNAPPGAGKSVIAMEAMEVPFFYLCSSKHLQRQIAEDYPVPILMGRENYRCPVFLNASLCLDSDCRRTCSYKEAKRKAFISNVAVLNFHYFLYLANYQGLSEKRNIVIDEADLIEDVLIDFISIVIGERELRKRGIKTRPEKKTVMSAFKEFLRELQEEVEERIKEVKRAISSQVPFFLSDAICLDDIREFKWFESLKYKCDFLLSQDLSTNWLCYYNEKKVYLRPKWLTSELTERYLFRHGERFLLMSGTLPQARVLAGLLGISLADMEYLDFGSEFSWKRRPVLFESKWKLGRKSKVDKEKIKMEVERLLDVEKEKGLIHTVNGELTDVLKEIENRRLIFHDMKNRMVKFKEFLESKDGVWVSPSSLRGIDLPYDLCRWILFIKAPFADLSDPVVSARAYSGKFGKLWYKSKCAIGIVQGSGRGVRYEDDYCRVYVWDGNALDLLKRSPSLFPLWFREAIEIRG